jgi:DNA-binding HxlR family transcriptional regulator
LKGELIGMGSNKFYSKVRKQLVEAMEIKESYETTKLRIAEEYEIKKIILSDLREKLKKLEDTNTVEADVTNYEAVKKEYEKLEESVKDLLNKLEKIDQYMEQHLETIIGKLRYHTEDQSNKYKYELMKAKYEFLAKAIAIRNSYLQINGDDEEFEELYQGLKLFNKMELPEAFRDLSPAIIKDGEGAISSKELHKALYSGKIPSELKKKLRQAEETTYVKSTD